MHIIAMIPARMGSQRLTQKNLRKIGGIPLITLAIRKARDAGVFSEVWVNSEHLAFQEIAMQENVSFHRRPAELANNQATSEEYIYEFLKGHPCDYLVQVHSIAPLLRIDEIQRFVHYLVDRSCDVLLSGVEEQIECMYQNSPINFSCDRKTNSQQLAPVQRITWSLTGWRTTTYLNAYDSGLCATYSGTVDFFPLSRLAGHIIKTEEDLNIAEALLHMNVTSERKHQDKR